MVTFKRYLYLDIPMAIISLILVSAFWENNILLFVLMLIQSAYYISMVHERTNNYLFMFVFAALAGPTAESIAIHFGAWTYGAPNFGYIPLWLSPLWGMAAIFMVRTYKRSYSFIKK